MIAHVIIDPGLQPILAGMFVLLLVGFVGVFIVWPLSDWWRRR
jgi:hypothetical protein